jgi:hypothetical protein
MKSFSFCRIYWMVKTSYGFYKYTLTIFLLALWIYLLISNSSSPFWFNLTDFWVWWCTLVSGPIDWDFGSILSLLLNENEMLPSAAAALLFDWFLFLLNSWLYEESFFKLLFRLFDSLDFPFWLVPIENVPYLISFSRLSLYSYFLFLIAPKLTLKWSIWLSTVRFNDVSLE